MSSCGICNEVKEQVLVFPCSDQHKACRQCLQALVIEPGTAVKCPECRRLFGNVNFDLWKVEGGAIPVQQICSSCLEAEEGEASLSVQFCIDCDQQLCEDCFQCHQRLHRGRKAHKTIQYDEYRVSSDKFNKWQCGTHDLHVTEACSKCAQVGCLRCQIDLADCPSGGKHSFVTLKTKSEKTSSVIGGERDATQAVCIAADEKLKKLLQSMEDYRVEITDRRSKLQSRLDSKIEQLKMEHGQLDGEFENRLQEMSKQVEADRECLLQKVISLQNLHDGLGAVLASYHPARLVESEERIKLRVKEETTLQETAINFNSPQLVQTAVNQTDLLGMSLSVADQELIKEPSSLTHTRTILPPDDQVTWTVSHSSIGDDPIVHGGKMYINLSGLNTGSHTIICTRVDDRGNLLMLKVNSDNSENWFELDGLDGFGIGDVSNDENDEDDRKGDVNDERGISDDEIELVLDDDESRPVIVTYEQKISPDGQISYAKSQTPTACVIGFGQFIQVDDETYYQTEFILNQIFIHKKGQMIRAGWCHDDMKGPWGICRHKDQLFVACRHTIMTFSHADPSNTLRKFSTTDTPLSGICYHHGYLYALSWPPSEGQIFIFNMEGEKVKTLNIPEAGSKVSDISINEDGCVAVAAAKRGVVLYQLNYKE